MPLPKKRFLFIILLLFFFVLIRQADPAGVDSKILDGIDTALVRVYSPFQKLWLFIDNSISNVWDDYIWLIDVKKENEILFQENIDLSIKNLELRQKNHEFELLLKNKELTDKLDLNWIEAEVMSYDPSFRNHIIWISEGTSAGIKMNSPVMTAEGLVGRVIKLSSNTAQVLLLSDENFTVSVVEQTSRVKATLSGWGRELKLERFPLLTKLEYLDQNYEFGSQAKFFTSGLSYIYPPGIPVGFIHHPEDIIIPYADLSKLERVLVISPYREIKDSTASNKISNI